MNTAGTDDGHPALAAAMTLFLLGLACGWVSMFAALVLLAAAMRSAQVTRDEESRGSRPLPKWASVKGRWEKTK